MAKTAYIAPPDSASNPPFPRHPLSAAFGPMDGDEYGALTESARSDGFHDPRILTLPHDGKPHVLDGWHRQAAALDTDRLDELEYIPFDGSYEDAVRLAFAANSVRRHQSAGYRACVIVGFLDGDWVGPGRPSNTLKLSGLDLTEPEMASLTACSAQTIRRAKQIHRAGLISDVLERRESFSAVHARAQQALLPPAPPEPAPVAHDGPQRGTQPSPPKPEPKEAAKRPPAPPPVDDDAQRIADLESEVRYLRAQVSTSDEDNAEFVRLRGEIKVLEASRNTWMARSEEAEAVLRACPRCSKAPRASQVSMLKNGAAH